MAKLPPPLKKGDHIRVIAPTGGIQFVADETIQNAITCLENIGLHVSLSKHCRDEFTFSEKSIYDRLDDLHEAFQSISVQGVLSLIGGLNSIQLVTKIDYDLISTNPKFFCGYSDITAVQNAITARSGIITYNGPHFQTFGIKDGNDFTIDHFHRMAFHASEEYLPNSLNWSDDEWYLDQKNRLYVDNRGPSIISEGKGCGHIVGGNLSTLLLLAGTEYMPDYAEMILILEEDEDVEFRMFDRMLESLLLNYKNRIRGILIGRFQTKSDVSADQLNSILHTRPYLSGVPIIANMDFGHTNPMLTLPIGGRIDVNTSRSKKIRLLSNS